MQMHIDHELCACCAAQPCLHCIRARHPCRPQTATWPACTWPATEHVPCSKAVLRRHVCSPECSFTCFLRLVSVQCAQAYMHTTLHVRGMHVEVWHAHACTRERVGWSGTYTRNLQPGMNASSVSGCTDNANNKTVASACIYHDACVPSGWWLHEHAHLPRLRALPTSCH